MLNELLHQLRRYDMVAPGDTVTCAVSGGADSMALLWGMYLLREKLGITLAAAHFNHHLRGQESQRDENFVREFCDRFDIPLTVGGAAVKAGKKGLESAAREARYAFFDTLSGKIATAHTADDNAETVLMHIVRGTGLKGLGGIAPINGRCIRPMLGCTRQQVMAFLEEYHIPFVEDSSNAEDTFLRNRLRHQVMPILKAENPRLAENMSAMAMDLRRDEAALAELAKGESCPSVTELKAMPSVVRSRVLERFLKENGVKEPERAHIALAEQLVFSEKPSASARFPGGVKVARRYDCLVPEKDSEPLDTAVLPEQGSVLVQGFCVTVSPANAVVNSPDTFTVIPAGSLVLRCRQSGDEIRLAGGTKSVKKLFIDRKIPAAQRLQIPVIADEKGVLGVYGIGVNLDRAASALPAVQIRFEDKIIPEEK